MAATVKVMRLDIYEDDGVGPLKCDIHLEIADDAVSADAAAAGVGKTGKVLRGRVPRVRSGTPSWATSSVSRARRCPVRSTRSARSPRSPSFGVLQ